MNKTKSLLVPIHDPNLCFFSLLFSLLFHQALCGCTINASTLGGKTVTVSTSDIVKPGMKRRVSGEGLPYPKRPDRRGDLIVEYEVKFPERLTQSARDTIAQVLPRSWTRRKDFLPLTCQLSFLSVITWMVMWRLKSHQTIKDRLMGQVILCVYCQALCKYPHGKMYDMNECSISPARM